MSKLEKVRSVADIKDLMHDINTSQGNLCHWAIEYAVKIPDLTLDERKALGIEDEEGESLEVISPWATDEMIIQAGPDAMEAISWLIAYTQDPEQYGIPVLGFRLTSINLISEADAVVE